MPTEAEVRRRIAEDAQWFPAWCRSISHDELYEYNSGMAYVIVRNRARQ